MTIMSNRWNLGRTRRNGRTTNSRMHAILSLSLIFMVGIIVGHFHGRLMSSPIDMMFLETATVVASTTTTTTTTPPGRRQDGWDSIDIFHGAKESPVVVFPLEEPQSHVKEPLPQHKDQQQQQLEWFSQAGQDEVVMALLRNKTGGYFVDLAANDATHWSNTYVLETRFGWNGLCIEPNPMYWENLAYRRKCHVVAAVVGKERMAPIHFRFNAGHHGGIVGREFDNGPKFQSQSSLRYTVTLEEILSRFQAPSYVDYLSLDVEGAEEFILTNFPFDKYHISILTTERPSEALKQRLNREGFRNVVRMTRWGEILWAHESVWDSLDLSVLDRMNEIKATYAKRYA